MAFLKTIWKQHKHKKLSDEWDLKQSLEPGHEMIERHHHPDKHQHHHHHLDEPGSTLEGITFNVRYLGSSLVSSPSDPKATAEAVKNIVSIAKLSKDRKGKPVQFAINLRGISVMDLDSKNYTLDISLYRISYCSADATYGQVFAFIATNDNDTMECHAFLCEKRKMAQLISITVAQTFNTAYHLWKMNNNQQQAMKIKLCQPNNNGILDRMVEEKRPTIFQSAICPLPLLIDLTSPIEQKSPPDHKDWASFED